MKDYNFIVKVSDILHTAGSNDTVVFTNKFSTRIPHLTAEGIACKITLQSLNKEEVRVAGEDCSCSIEVECDRCGASYVEELRVDEFSVKVWLKKQKQKLEDLEEDIFIDPKNEVIDLEHYMTNTLLLTRSVVNLCTQCQQIEDRGDDDIEESTTIVRKT